MSDASWQVQKAVFTTLDAALSASVYDAVPQNASFPYVVIGDDTINDNSTKTTESEDMTLTIHVWSDYQGRKEVKQILGSVKTALHKATLSLTGFTNVLTLFDFEDTFLDEDGITRHGVSRYRMIVQKD